MILFFVEKYKLIASLINLNFFKFVKLLRKRFSSILFRFNEILSSF